MATLVHDIRLDSDSPDSDVTIVEADEGVPTHVIEADETESVLVVEEDDEETTGQVVASSELWQSSNEFLRYVRRAAKLDIRINKYSANTLRATIAHLEDVKQEIVHAAMSTDTYADFTGEQLQELDKLEDHIEQDVAELRNSLENLEQHRNETILSNLQSRGLIKKAWKSADVQLYADPFTYGVTRLCINAKVANGKNIEEVFAQLCDHFSLDDRDKFAIAMLLRDSGYPIRGSLVGDVDQIKQYFG